VRANWQTDIPPYKTTADCRADLVNCGIFAEKEEAFSKRVIGGGAVLTNS